MLSDSVRIVTQRGLKELLERHVELFNAAVSSGDYDPYLATFAEDAVLRFDGFPLGPFVGRPAIAEAYAMQPATDTIALIAMEEVGTDAVRAAFEWDAGGTGEMYLRWDGVARASARAAEVKLVELAVGLARVTDHETLDVDSDGLGARARERDL
jgi:steroid delta-isomerase